MNHVVAPIAHAKPATMSSREIAELVEARHNDVVATIERLFDKGLLRSNRKSRREATGGHRRAGNAHWVGYQHRLQTGVLEQKATIITKSDGEERTVEQVLVTAKGLARLSELMGVQA